MENKSMLIVMSSPPYKGSDVSWNALRLADTALKKGTKTRIFLINEGVDIGCKGPSPEGSFDLYKMLDDLAQKGAEVKYCKTCVDRCGISAGAMLGSIQSGSMGDLHAWMMESDTSVTF